MSTLKSNQIKGALYGFAIGDAMGATTEFMTAQQIKKQYGKVDDIVGGGWLNLKAGEVTDDTQMMLCVADALMVAGHSQDKFVKAVRKNFIKWMDSKPKDVGGQCLRGIQHTKATGRIMAPYDKTALGNGSLMRALPCALAGVLNWNVIQGAMTHHNEECGTSIRLYHQAINGQLKEQGVLGTLHKEPTGHVRNTFFDAMYWVNQTSSLEEAIIAAVNDGGDADTIAAITGSIAGIKYGYEAIPERWIAKLDFETKKELEKFSKYLEKAVAK